MSELLQFKKSIIRGVSQHFLREQDRAQSDVDMYNQFVATCVTNNYPNRVNLEFAQKILKKSQNELDVTKFYYTTPYAYAVKCLSEINTLMQAHDVTYEMTSTITSCIFSLMQMGCEPWIKGCERPMFCRWLWDHWTTISPPTDHDSTWAFLHIISCKFMFAMSKTHLPIHPEPIPENSVTKTNRISAYSQYCLLHYNGCTSAVSY